MVISRNFKRRLRSFYSKISHDFVNLTGVSEEGDDAHFRFTLWTLKWINFQDAFHAGCPRFRGRSLMVSSPDAKTSGVPLESYPRPAFDLSSGRK